MAMFKSSVAPWWGRGIGEMREEKEKKDGHDDRRQFK
jgi:hypothetical protein